MKSFLSLKAHFWGVVLDSFGEGAPLKINMEPKNHLFEKENLGKGTLLENNISPKKGTIQSMICPFPQVGWIC